MFDLSLQFLCVLMLLLWTYFHEYLFQILADVKLMLHIVLVKFDNVGLHRLINLITKVD